jgi:hypothetical protein
MSVFTKTQFAAMLKAAAAKIAEEHESLSALDAATGDGDHGVTITVRCRLLMQPLTRILTNRLASLLKLSQ